jgi:sigma-B regulation protein RsbU (phosphoserine phosphatase)
MTERITAFLRRQPRSVLAAAGLGALAALEIVDYFAPPELSFLLFYIGPVLFLVWFVGRWAGFLGAALSGAFWAWEDVLSPHAYPSAGVADWNVGMRLIFVVAFVCVVAELKGALERERLAAQERLERDVRIAQEVQARLFPQMLPRSANLELHGVCRPARGVAGDYYDFVDLGPGRVGIAVGDVAGKGISAALLMASLQGALRSRSALFPDGPPAETSRFINAQLHARTDPRRFATFFWGVFDEERGSLAYVNAGHNPPMLLKRDGTIERLRAGGPPLGVFPDAHYEQASTELAADDTLLIFSDGVTQAPDPRDEEFGEARLESVLRAAAELPAAAICDAVLSAVFEFQSGAPQEDDMTVVAGRRRLPADAVRPAS